LVIGNQDQEEEDQRRETGGGFNPKPFKPETEKNKE